ncbi:F2RL3 isoform 2 [Pongo abelii]|uniref:F2RL3 isoform 2 n=1 Tax=Pongo abelii TaxID=9601 RepID=A0A2J8T6N9_PONAB|nr:F2RL3 isoform 2 [Pongo abelii]
MWGRLLLWPLMLGFSLSGGTQTPSVYDESGSTGGGDARPQSCLPPAATQAKSVPMTVTPWSSRTAHGHCFWAGSPPGWCLPSMGWSWRWGCRPTGWRCGCWPRGHLGCPPPCC